MHSRSLLRLLWVLAAVVVAGELSERADAGTRQVRLLTRTSR